MFLFAKSSPSRGVTATAFVIFLTLLANDARFATAASSAASSDGDGLQELTTSTTERGGGSASSSLRDLLSSVAVPADVDGSVSGNHHRQHSGLRRGLEPALDENTGFKITKSTKSFPKEICYKQALVYALEGPASANTGANGGAANCAAEQMNLVSECTAAPPDPSMIEDKSEDYLKCMEDEGYRLDNWWFGRDTTGTYQITPPGATNGDGDGAFKASISTAGVTVNSAAAEKVELEYSNVELIDKDVGLLTKVAFDYYIDRVAQCTTCGTPSTTACANTPTKALKNIFVNIYTRETAGKQIFYDCRYNFVLGAGGLLDAPSTLQEWHSISFNPLVQAAASFAKWSGSSVTCPTTYRAAAEAGYVLGYGKIPPGTPEDCTPLIEAASVKLEVGDSSCVDSGMIVYFGNIQIEFPYADGTDAHVYNFFAKD